MRDLDELPTPPAWPLLGHALALDRRRPHVTLERWAAAYGAPYTFRVLNRRSVVWTDPDVIQTVLRERPQRYRRSIVAEQVFGEMGIKGVASAEGDAWHVLRRALAPTLAPQNVRAAFPLLRTITQRLLKRWHAAAGAAAVVDMRRDLKRYTVDTACAVVFGEDVNTVEQDQGPLAEALGCIFPMLMKRLNNPVPVWRYIKLPQDRRLDRALCLVREYVQELIARADERLRQVPTGAPPRNFLEALLQLRGTPGAGLDRAEELQAHGVGILLAGEDSTAQSLSWTVFHLTADRDLQDRVYAQLPRCADGDGLCPGYEALQQLDVAEALATEALRLRPVAPINLHHPLQDVELDGVRVPAGTPIIFIYRPAMVDARFFRNPQSYEPLRWLRGAADPGAAHEPRVHMPFGLGGRVCPGRALASATTRLLLGMLLRHFRVELAMPRDQVQETLAITMGPNRLQVRLMAR